MKLVIISDTHGFHNELGKLPRGDVLIHCGDATMRGKPWELFPFFNWLASQPHARKIFVPGNHDFDIQKEESLYRNACRRQGISLLVDEEIAYNGVRFYGSPWVPNLEGWAYYAPPMKLTERFGAIPNNTDVLVTHAPPYGVLDQGVAHFGSEELARRVHGLNLRVHLFGHIHESYGIEDHGVHRYSVNACSCNISYECINPPIVLDI